MGKYCIYGGAFDPPTIGHFEIIEHLKTVFDTVVVMPSGIPPHKKISSSHHRLQMLRTALCDDIISLYEVEKPSACYTAETLEDFPNATLVVGGDSLMSLLSWYNPQRVLELADLYVVPRPDIDGCVNTKMLEQMSEFLRQQYGARIEIAPFIGKDISSTEVRVAVAFNDFSHGVSRAVGNYINEHNLYNDYSNYTLFLRKYLECGKGFEKLEHTKEVALMSARLAKKNNVDVDDAVVAAILHDVAKYVSVEQAEREGVVERGALDGIPSSVSHAHIGAEIAKRELGVSEDIYNAIKWHTTGRRGMSRLEKVVFAADAVEIGRVYPNVEKLRAAVLEDLENGVVLLLKNLLAFLTETKQHIDNNTSDALNALLEDI